MVRILAVTLVHSLWEQAVIAVIAARVAERAHHRPAIERLRVYELAALASVAAPLLTAWVLTRVEGTPAPTPGWTAAVALAWAIGAGTSAVRLGVEGLRVEWVRARSIAAPPALTAAFGRLAAQLGLRGVELRIVADGWSPMAVGVVRRAVLVPAGLLAKLPSDQLEALLLHELVHLRRWDPLAVAAQLVFEAALFHHPATWWLSARLRHTREQVCDAEVASRVAPLPYAHALARVAELTALHAAAAAAGGEVLERVERIVGRSPRPHRARWLLPVAAAALALGFTTGDGAVADTPGSTAPPVRSTAWLGSLSAPVPVRTTPSTLPPAPLEVPVAAPLASPPIDEPPAVRILPLDPVPDLDCADLDHPPLSLHVCGTEADLALVWAFEPRFVALADEVADAWRVRERRLAQWARVGQRFGDGPSFAFTPPEGPVSEQLDAWAEAAADYATRLEGSVPVAVGRPDPRCIAAYEPGMPPRLLTGRCGWTPARQNAQIAQNPQTSRPPRASAAPAVRGSTRSGIARSAASSR